MIAHDVTAARMLARIAGHSLLIRKTARVTRDLPEIGMVLICVARSNQIQAVAVGLLDQPPLVVPIADPFSVAQPALDRVGDLLFKCLHIEEGCQVWLPDRTTLATLAIEGRRSRRNPRVTAARKQLGIGAYALARLAEMPGQQHVVVATDVLRDHLISGQSPAEDAHLAALLAWASPSPGKAPALVAAQRRLHAGPSLLPIEDDEHIEALRSPVSQGTATGGEIAEIERVLRKGALQRWDLLRQARAVYLGLPLAPLPGSEELVEASQRELIWLLSRSPAFGAHLGATRAEFRKRELWRATLEDLEARGDAVIREALREEGRVVAATTLRVRTPRKKGQDTCILLATSQLVLRIREGTKLKTRDGAIEAVVDRLRYRITGPTFMLLRVTRGKLAARKLAAGGDADWFDTVLFRGRPSGSRQAARLAGIPSSAVLVPRVPVPGNLLSIARKLRQP